MFHENTTKEKVLKYVGIKDDDLKPRLSIRYKPINQAVRKEINYKLSKHVKQIQRSCYLKIDDDTNNHKEIIHSDFKDRDPELYSLVTNTGYKREFSN